MKSLQFLFLFMICLHASASQATSVKVFDEVLFYDGYASTVSEPVAEGVIRHRNDLFARKLSDQEIADLGSQITAEVKIKAACDNYDRIGSLNLALVPKGSSTYDPNGVSRLELGRFITPFMNKNIKPDVVPYSFTLDNLAAILKDEDTQKRFDFWMELEVFGVPYAANTQVAGCAGRNDVFYGSLDLLSSNPNTAAVSNFLLPLNFKKNLNNYAPGASDAIGQTVRTIAFEVPHAIDDARLYLITSNHGANAGGEEYNRRVHTVFFDEALVLSYTPGGISCEPFRVYNTQANGIYGYQARTPAQWASFSNWCPGQAIPIRVINLGRLEGGAHSFKIAVPSAVFVGAQGDIPVSLYLQGTTGP